MIIFLHALSLLILHTTNFYSFIHFFMKAHNIALATLLLSSAFVAPSLNASPLVSIGDNADIFFNGSSSLQWSSNVFRNETNEQDDFLWTITPGFELDLGRGLSNLNIGVIARYEVRRYDDLDELDTELFNISANAAYQTSRLDLSGSVYFRERKTNSGSALLGANANDLVESDLTGGNVNGEYRFSPKFSFGTGFSYSETEFTAPFDTTFANRETYTVPLDVFYELTPKVDLSVGYAYSETDTDAVGARTAFTTENHFLNVGARGDLLPKLVGFFKVGVRDRDVDRVGSSSSDSTMGLDADLTWSLTPKFTTRLGLGRDFGVGGDGFTSEDTSVSVVTNYAINANYSATAFGNFVMREYDINRDDDQLRLGARLNYTPNEHWRFGVGYTYSETDSEDSTLANPSARSFEDHTIDLTASLRY